MKYTFLLFFVSILCSVHLSVSIATYAIDLSSEFLKVAIVKPGVPMEIALNKDSQRKAPAVVYIRNNERLFDNSAVNMGIKFPKNMYHSLTRLLGKSIDHPDIKQFLIDYPYYEMVMTENGLLAFKHDDKTVYTVEELLGMILQHAKDIADNFGEMKMKGGIIVIPPYFSQAQRRSIMRSAAIAKVNVLQLMNSNAAVALNYGIFRRKMFNATMQYYMFYDVGSSATISSIVGYQMVKIKEYGMLVENPQLSVFGIGYNVNLGTSQFILRLQKHLANAFNKMKKTKDVTKVPRAMAKLYKEAASVLKVLSANSETQAQVENVMDEIDLRVKVTRVELEAMCSDLFEKFREPLIASLESAQIPMPTVKEIILMGGGTRIPKLQDFLMKAGEKTELGKSINTDEAAALGAVYQAAYISPGFRVKSFVVKDCNLVPVSAEFYRQKTVDEKLVTQHTSRILFNFMNPFPQKKVLTFNKHLTNFDFNITLGEKEKGTKLLFKVSVENLTQITNTFMVKSDKYETEFKGVKAHFGIDSSGIFSLNYIEALFERKWNSAPEKSTLEKIGNTISNLFGSKTNDKSDDGKAGEESKEGEQKSTGNGQENNKEAKSNDGSSGTKSNSAESNNKSTNKSTNNNSTLNSTQPMNETKPLIEKIHENIKFTIKWNYPESQDDLKQPIKLLEDLKAADEAKLALEQAQNELEAYMFQTRSVLEENEIYRSVSSEAERTKIMSRLTEMSTWYDEEAGVGTERQEYTKRYQELRGLMTNIEYRVKERRALPDMIRGLSNMLNTSYLFLDNLRNLTGDASSGGVVGSIYTPTELNTFGSLVNNTQEWFTKANETLKVMNLQENPKITSGDFETHIKALEREMAYLFNKLNIWRNQAANNPPPPPNNASSSDEVPVYDTNKTKDAKDDVTPDEDSSKKYRKDDVASDGDSSKKDDKSQSNKPQSKFETKKQRMKDDEHQDL